MWSMWKPAAVLVLLTVLQPGNAQERRSGNSDDAIRRLEREVAQLRSEIKKLQDEQNRPRTPQVAERRRVDFGPGPGGVGLGPWSGFGPARVGFGPGRFGNGPGWAARSSWAGPGRKAPWKRHGRHHSKWSKHRKHQASQQRSFAPPRQGERGRFDERRPATPPARDMKRPEPPRRAEPASFRSEDRQERRPETGRSGPPPERSRGERPSPRP